jgi:hypothetical protein
MRHDYFALRVGNAQLSPRPMPPSSLQAMQPARGSISSARVVPSMPSHAGRRGHAGDAGQEHRHRSRRHRVKRDDRGLLYVSALDVLVCLALLLGEHLAPDLFEVELVGADEARQAGADHLHATGDEADGVVLHVDAHPPCRCTG